jgi:hypothetical protein
MKRWIVAVSVILGALAAGCSSGDPCGKLLKYYCEEMKGPQAQLMCKEFTNRVNAGMSKEACQTTYGNVVK